MQTPNEAIATKDHINGVNKDLMMLHALQGKGPTEIAKELKCDKSYVSRTLKPFKDEIKAYLAYKEDPMILWEWQEFKVLRSVNDEDIKKANLTMKSTFAGTARDKINAKRGLSNENKHLIVNIITESNVVLSDKIR